MNNNCKGCQTIVSIEGVKAIAEALKGDGTFTFEGKVYKFKMEEK